MINRIATILFALLLLMTCSKDNPINSAGDNDTPDNGNKKDTLPPVLIRQVDTTVSQPQQCVITVDATDDGHIELFYWDLNGDGTYDDSGADVTSHSFKSDIADTIEVYWGAKDTSDLMSCDSFAIAFNPLPSSFTMITPTETAQWSDENAREIAFEYIGVDPEAHHDTLSYKLWVSLDSSQWGELRYNGRETDCNISSLTENATYFWKVEVVDLWGGTLTETGSFKTPAINDNIEMIDIDGNTYKTVKIGNQIWTAENYKCTTYNTGKAMLHQTNQDNWTTTLAPAYCYYFNTKNFEGAEYGPLYNWYIIQDPHFAPEGWHVPTKAEWDTLQNYLITHGYNWDKSSVENRIGKSLASVSGWNSNAKEGKVGNDTTTNNSSGFNALPGGYRTDRGFWQAHGSGAYFWSSSEHSTKEAHASYLWFTYDELVRFTPNKKLGAHVRFVKD